jgi:hypothetical protein
LANLVDMGYDPLSASVTYMKSVFCNRHIDSCAHFSLLFQTAITEIATDGHVPSLGAAVERLIDSHVDSPSGDPPLVSARTSFAATATAAPASDSHPDATRAIYDFICSKRM